MSEPLEIKGTLIDLWGNELEYGETRDDEQTAAALKFAEVTDRIASLSDKLLPVFNVTGAFKKISEGKAEVNIGKLAELMVPIVEYYEVNQDIIDRVEEWPALTGLTTDELDQMELHEVVSLIRGIIETQNIEAEDTLELVIVDTAAIKPKPGGAINQAEATRSIYELYGTIPSGPVTALTKKLLHNPERVTSTRRGQIKQTTHYQTKVSIITYKGKDSNLTVTLAKEFKKIPKGPRVFNFLLEKLNEQNFAETITFATTELINRGIYANKDSAVKGMRNCLKNMQGINFDGSTTEYDSARKKVNQAYASSCIIADFNIDYTYGEVAIARIIRMDARGFYILPEWSYGLNDNAYYLLDYIYAMARQNYTKIDQRGYFNISLDTIRAHLGLPEPKEAKRNANKLIMDPIEKAIDEIIKVIPKDQAGLEIERVYNCDQYKTTRAYLEGYLQIKLDETAQAYLKERAIAYQKEKTKEARRIEAAKRKAIERAATKAIQEAAATIEK